jgi:hypothetical protein
VPRQHDHERGAYDVDVEQTADAVPPLPAGQAEWGRAAVAAQLSHHSPG